MARLQILELPEGTDDDRPPFVLVIDQARVEDFYPNTDAETAWQTYIGKLVAADPLKDMAERAGARAVLVFEDTIDIPANDTSAFALNAGEPARAQADKIQARATEAVQAAHERTDIAREMDRLANHKAAVTDALGMDPTRDWDDIRNAAAGIRRSRDSMRDAIQRVRNLDEEPAIMDAHQAEPTGYLLGYAIAIRAAKQASREQPTHG